MPTLKEILAKKRPAATENVRTLFLHGVIEPDHSEEYFRLYPSTHDRKDYYLIKRADLKNEPYTWSEAEMAAAGQLGSPMHRIELDCGTQIIHMSVTIETLGETLAGDDSSKPMGTKGDSLCRFSRGCAKHKCCSIGDDGRCYCDNCCLS